MATNSRKRSAFARPDAISILAQASSARASWQSDAESALAGYPDLRVQIPPASAAVAAPHHHHHHGHDDTDRGNHHHHHHHDDEHASKRPRVREPSSPTSVGDIDDPKAIPRCVHTTMGEPPAALQQSVLPPAAAAAVSAAPQAPVVRVAPPAPRAAPVASANPAKMQSVIRGLQHVSECPVGCSNPLCVSTRNFVSKVAAHMTAMSERASHDATKCGACQLWTGIVASHTQTCKTSACAVPLCAQRKQGK